MPQTVNIVNAFAAPPLRGNPAGVCILCKPKPARWMQAVAAKVNLSETAFAWPAKDGWSLRWFTPKTEVDLCGHATMACAYVLWRDKRSPQSKPIRFHTSSGLLKARKKRTWIELDFPALNVAEEPLPETARALFNGNGISFAKTKGLLIAELHSEHAVRNYKPDYEAIGRLPAAGLVITSRAASNRFDIVSRCFYPKEGINEDPATGSAHCALAPFWQRRLKRRRFTALQASTRGGVIRIRLVNKRVLLAGRCVPARGKHLPP